MKCICKKDYKYIGSDIFGDFEYDFNINDIIEYEERNYTNSDNEIVYYVNVTLPIEDWKSKRLVYFTDNFEDFLQTWWSIENEE